ncbi:MAG: hypothetical protein WCR42_04525 [bacterium]
MKTKLVLIVIIALLTCFTNSYSQDQNIEQLSVMYNNQVTKLCDTIYGFKGPRGIIRGYQWGNEKSASIGILANQNSIKVEYLFKQVTFPPNPITYTADPLQAHENAYVLISDPRFWSATLDNVSLMHSHSMTFEPNFKIEPTYKQDSVR